MLIHGFMNAMTVNGAGRLHRPCLKVQTAFRVTVFVAAAGLLASANLEDFNDGRSTANLETLVEDGAICDEARVRRVETFHIDTSSVHSPDLSELHIRENVKVRGFRRSSVEDASDP